MRQISSFVAFVFIVAAVAGWMAATGTRANTYTVNAPDDFLGRYPIGGGLYTVPLVF
jgi:hypothetical protein